MKYLFIGKVKLSYCVLEMLLNSKKNIVGVISGADNGFNSDFMDLRSLCENSNIPYFLTNDVNSKETVNWVKAISPDAIFCIGWSNMLKSELLELPRLGVIGYHPSMLPKNRGRHPLIWALVLGLKETASSFFLMDENPDSGDIISQVKIEIMPDDDAGSLYGKIINSANQQIIEIINVIETGSLKVFKQDNVKSNYWRRRNIKDGEIDWRMSAVSIHDLVRGLAKPYVGAHFLYNDKVIKVWKTRVKMCNRENVEPGKVISVSKDNTLVIKCGINSIELLELELLNEKILEGDYL